MAVAQEEPILSKLDRLDRMIREVEEMKGVGKSSGESTPSSECRPLHLVVVETELKGTLLHRLNQVEDRILKLEEELQRHPKKKGLKHLVHKVVKAGSAHHL